ncbi:GNAT family N-acetyltransferase [Daejeonella lutea]|uniref:Ribosomal protein S18 acetylase RimI n=1 Tax=Daejeonella lutea TaxID=572036 RepID=A0A1T5B461_9SPHI|nr:GNAT family N-acetyltransferase [Daejeonella lutea]SKB41663.1 Ribosomal protein S18 acetylase RimI [Daejeonella lutea]
MSESNQIAVHIRESRPEDCEEVVALLQQLWPDRELNQTALKEAFLRSFKLEGHIIRVAVQGNRLVGLCSISIRNNLKAEGNLANIDELVVDESMRSQRIGKQLLDDAEEIVKMHGCQVLGLESSFHRVDAHRFYEENGYWKQGYYILRDLD